ncbi:MAG TPA: sialidase family protein, partial [Cryomorphaceae bacterium]|nr:sialidase family protein [Cryomorphaceae bacterium]
TKCDLSDGPNRGTIYVNWADQRNGADNTDIFLSTSIDQGLSWSEPIRVNQDTSENHQFFTWMDIDQTNGNLWFVYHDRRNHEDIGTDVYVAVSQDSGLSFKESKISESPFYPNPKIFFGDYNNIDVHGNVVRPVWTRLDKKQLSVRTAIVDAYSILNEDSLSITTSVDPNGELLVMHPLKGKVSITIRSLNGEEVLSKSRLKSTEGYARVPGASELSTGIYLVEVDNGLETAKTQWVKR